MTLYNHPWVVYLSTITEMHVDDVIKRYFQYIDIHNNTPLCNFENEKITSITIKEAQSHYDEIKIFSLQSLTYLNLGSMPFRKIIFEEVQPDLTYLILENSPLQVIEGLNNLPNLQNIYLLNIDCNTLDLSLNKKLEVINIDTRVAPYTNFNLSIYTKQYKEIRINNNLFINLT